MSGAQSGKGLIKVARIALGIRATTIAMVVPFKILSTNCPKDSEADGADVRVAAVDAFAA